jgi:hypothetical protein
MNGVRKYVKNKKEEIQQRARGVNPTIDTELPRTRDKKTKQKKVDPAAAVAVQKAGTVYQARYPIDFYAAGVCCIEVQLRRARVEIGRDTRASLAIR